MPWVRCVLIVVLLASLPSFAAGPPPRPRPPLPTGLTGSLVLAGGGQLPDSVRRRFVALAGGRRARLVIVAPSDTLEAWKESKVGARASLALHDPKKADDSAI